MEIYRRKDIPWRIIDKEALVVNPKTSVIFPLNNTSCRIWQLIDGARSAEDLTKAMLEEFDIDEETLRFDVKNFISQLEKEGLIEKI